MKVIFHIDLNAFYASAEQARHPEYKDKPLVVAGDSRRGIVTTASYQARQYGIHSAMPLFKAKELCKDLINVPVDHAYYRELSNIFFKVIASYSDIIEVASIDECYVDVSENLENSTNAEDILNLAKQIQDDVYKAIDIHCSIGVSPNKFLSKMASDMKKPNGITIITKQNLKEVLWVLPINKMFGIGKKTAPKLIELGILTIGDLAKYENFDKAKSILGKNTLIYHYRANGVDPSKINIDHNTLKSVGHSTTLPKDTSDEDEIKDLLKDLSRRVSLRASRRDLVSKNISITLKYTRFESVVRSISIDEYTNDYETILSNALILFERHFENKPIRLAGVSLNNTIERKDIKEQLSLFNYQYKEKNVSEIDKLVSSLNGDMGNSDLLMKASELNKSETKHIQKKYLKEES